MTDGSCEVEILIGAPPERVWEALTDPQQTRLFWHGALNHSTWQPGEPWTSESETGELYLDGMVVEADRPRRMVHTMRFLQDPAASAEPASLVEMTVTAVDGGVRLRLVNTNLGPASLENVTGASGWEHILRGMKSLLEGAPEVSKS